MAYRNQVGRADRLSPLTGCRTATIRVAVRVLFYLACAGLIAGVPATGALGHDIPQDITVRAFIKPEGQRLRLLVRVPLEAMRDVTFPLIGPGYLDLSRADEALRDAAVLWIGQEVSLFENGTRLAVPELAAIRVSLPTDPSFHGYDTALASVRGPALPVGTQIYWQQAMLDVLFEYRITSDRSEFSIVPGLETLGMQGGDGVALPTRRRR